ncbi:MAG: helix-turn-helix domain-containing protein [Rhodobacteraceae bacterium]|nr:helix-turn-helix domain-containing protein [Paracoccaceae bacterium]
MTNETNPKQSRDPRIDTARKNLRMAIALRGTNYAQTSTQAELSRNVVSQFINGKTSLSYANMLAICDVLDIPIGAMHRPDAITEARIKFWRSVERVPDHLVSSALRAVKDGLQTDD